MLHVGRMVKGRLIPAALMAFETALRIPLGIPTEGEDQLSGGRGLRVVPVRSFLRIGVGFAWTMAHLAACHRIGMHWRKRRMLGLPELLKLGFVT